MMPELWKRCENCKGTGGIPTADDEWWCADCARGDHPGLIRVPGGALLIEHPDQAIERIALYLDSIFGPGYTVEDVAGIAENALRAAVGEG